MDKGKSAAQIQVEQQQQQHMAERKGIQSGVMRILQLQGIQITDVSAPLAAQIFLEGRKIGRLETLQDIGRLMQGGREKEKVSSGLERLRDPLMDAWLVEVCREGGVQP